FSSFTSFSPSLICLICFSLKILTICSQAYIAAALNSTSLGSPDFISFPDCISFSYSVDNFNILYLVNTAGRTLSENTVNCEIDSFGKLYFGSFFLNALYNSQTINWAFL